MDAHLHALAELLHDALGRLRHLRRERRAVGVAERHVVRTGLGRRSQAAQGVVGLVAVGVEEVLGVVDHPLAPRAKEADRLRDHAQVLFRVDVGDLLEV